MYNLMKKLMPIYRSLTGEGNRQTLLELQKVCDLMQIHEIPSKTKAFDWTVPREWNIRQAYIEDENGKRIIDFEENHLHVVGYSMPVDKWVTREELLPCIYTQPDQPEVIPYVTSYYSERYGFCMSENQKNALPEGRYHIYIDSEFKEDGSMTVGEIVIPGETEEEICFSTYICHPNMANNELSGPCVLIHLAEKLRKKENLRYTYRFLFHPETIGSITYISRHLEEMQKNIKAGFVITCVGDDRTYSYLPSRKGDTLADKALKNILKNRVGEYTTYSFLQRGSDERQYCAPGVDLPFCVFCRSKFGEYPEYHTSADDLNCVSEEGLQSSLETLEQLTEALESNATYQAMVLCEAQLGKRGLYPTISQKNAYAQVRVTKDFLAYADGTVDLFEMSEIIDASMEELSRTANRLLKENLIKRV